MKVGWGWREGARDEGGEGRGVRGERGEGHLYSEPQEEPMAEPACMPA